MTDVVTSGDSTNSDKFVQPSVGQRAATGFIWLTLQVIATKGVNFVGQIILARLLSTVDYGLIGLAYSVSSFPNLIQRAGTREVLIHRANRFDRWSNAAFWMSGVLGLLSAIAHIVLAPIAVWYYKQPALGGLLIVLGLFNILNPLSIVPETKLQIDLRFRFVAIFGLVTGVASTLLTIAFAYMGGGAYSFLWPMVILGVVRTVVFYFIAKPRLRWKLDIHRWSGMYFDSGMVFLSWLCLLVIQNGDYLIIGAFHGADVTGIYFWAYNLSLQTYQLLALNLANVLFPALQKMQNDPIRMSNAFTKACKILMLLGVPVCVLQMLLAQPIVHLLFKPTWYSGIPALQVLSLGMSFQLLLHPALSFLQAQGRFKDATRLMAGLAVLFLILVAIAAACTDSSNAVLAVSIAVLVFFLLAGPIAAICAYPKPQRKLQPVLTIIWIPVLAVLVSALFATAIIIFNGSNALSSLKDIHFVVMAAIFIVGYVGIAFAADRSLLRTISNLRRR